MPTMLEAIQRLLEATNEARASRVLKPGRLHAIHCLERVSWRKAFFTSS
jgi:hypothetical protein